MQRISQILVLIGIGTLFFRRGIIKPYSVQPFEFFIILAALTLLIFFIIHKEKIGELKSLSEWAKIFLTIVLFGVAGSINAYRIYGIDENIIKGTEINLFYIFISSLSFLLTYFFAKKEIFKKYISIALLSPLIFSPFLLLPSTADALNLVSGKTHFQGLTTNPSEFALLCLLALVSLFTFFIEIKGLIKKIILWISITSIISLIIWTGSRTAWLLIGISVLFFAIYSSKNRIGLKAKIKHFSLFILCSITTVALAFAILPHRGKIMMMDRVFPQITNYNPAFFKLDQISTKDVFYKIKIPAIKIPYQERASLWSQAINLSIKHPFLGLGFDYNNSSQQITQNGKPTSAHNTLLQSVLIGGIGLLLLFLLIIFKGIKRLYKNKEKDQQWVILVLFGIVLISFFMVGDFLFALPWMWIPMALIFAK